MQRSYIAGSHVEGNESIIKQIVAEGHELETTATAIRYWRRNSADEVYQEVHKDFWFNW